MTHADEIVFLPARAEAPESRPLMLVLPGGGYAHHAPHEAEPVAAWLNDAGLNAVVFRYPVAPQRHPEPIVATRSLLAALRRGEHGAFDVSRIGVLGFSAGGHLAATLSSAPTAAERAAHDIDARPDLAILCYPVISMTDLVHRGSVDALLGLDAPVAARAALDADALVDERTPPTFLWHTAADEAVPVTHALAYTRALVRHGVPADLHVFAEGAHGKGLATGLGPLEGWTRLAVDWIREQGW
ncbi:MULTISPECIES: alpha/beta hydrolase [unclassified Microbacterium]|uniref:alpha/beta hydrolase n=1 Tax=Microbacterium TaxID=33882 RepID=UPI003B9E844F